MFAQCAITPTLSKGYTWPPSSTVSIVNYGVPSGDLQTAASNWSTDLLLGFSFSGGSVCYSPDFTTGVGTGETINMSFTTIPVESNPPGGSDNQVSGGVPVVRGLTDLEHATFAGTPARLYVVAVYINSAMTADAAITEVVAHEIGHTLGLADCNYPGCAAGSSVMEANAPVSTINGTSGQPGPTSCDVSSVLSVATDYLCPPPSPPPPQCCPYNFFTGGCTPCTSPIILDTDGHGFHLTGAQDGVTFDISGSDHPIQIGWTASGSTNAFLALPGPDGLVHMGSNYLAISRHNRPLITRTALPRSLFMTIQKTVGTATV